MNFLSAIDACTNSSILKIILFIKELLKIVFILLPIGLIIMISVDLAKNVISGKIEDMKKNVNIALKRVMMAVIVFFIPTIVGFAIGLLGNDDTSYTSCINNATTEKIQFYQQLEETQREEELANRITTAVPDISTTTIVYSNPTTSGEAVVYFLNVGSADAMIIQSNGKFGMIDTSCNSGKEIVELLKKLGVKELEFVMITHKHIDHVGGYNDISNAFKIKTLYIKTAGKGYAQGYTSVINKAQKDKTNIQDAGTIDGFTMGSINFKFYNKEFTKYSGSQSKGDNGNSIVALATVNGVRIYFCGDIGNYFGKTQESDTAKEVGHVDVYKVAHHGYTTYNNHEDAIQALSPIYSVFTNDKSGTSLALERIKNNPNYKAHYYTGDGTVVMKISKSGEITFTQEK